jgi:hypothetical protein
VTSVPPSDLLTLRDHALLDRLQRAAFAYMIDYANGENGLVADTSRPGAPASIAVAGFALSCYPIGVERGWIGRDQAAGRALAALRFFRDSRQGPEPDATGYKGFYYHFLDMKTGARTWRSELSVMDTALLLAGVLCAAAYFAADTPREREIRDHADAIYSRVDWPWAKGNDATTRQGWTPETGFLRHGWDGYDEAAILYVLGLASPERPLADDSYRSWTEAYQWVRAYDVDYLYAGPLFIHQFSHAWIDFAGVQDAFMRDKGSDYFRNSQAAVAVHREYARRNPQGFVGYDEDFWGLSACDGPRPGTRTVRGVKRRVMGYAARGAPFGPDDGCVSPIAALASLPFAPEAALASVRALIARHPQVIVGERLPSSFNPTLPGRTRRGWVCDAWFGLDQGLLAMMIENHRTGLIWRLMRSCPHIPTGLRRAGFTGGWLTDDAGAPPQPIVTSSR